jgi:hypothetical protein
VVRGATDKTVTFRPEDRLACREWGVFELARTLDVFSFQACKRFGAKILAQADSDIWSTFLSAQCMNLMRPTMRAVIANIVPIYRLIRCAANLALQGGEG